MRITNYVVSMLENVIITCMGNSQWGQTNYVVWMLENFKIIWMGDS